ncbi:phage tail assembly chaperone [Pseudomonas sp. 2(2015)]|uniref:phage tail assembly chaperone n=1 Tax=Pseudomonas sp. 2(2015) TaxID=1619950 RepID=UPI000A49D42D|nr:phage tail assembly chaperone [Pseudomonas sp. 2(2015)]
MAERYWFVVDGTGRLLGRLDTVVNREVPPEAVPVSKRLFEQSLEAPRGLQCYFVDDAVEFRPFEGLAATEQRDWRNAQLAGVEWLRNRHRDEQDLQREPTLSAQQFSELLAFMQQLREWPQTEQFPDAAHRPVAPAWIAEQVQ